MDKFYYKNILIGIRIRKIPSGSVPATEESQPLQLVTLKHPKGAYLKAHLHKPKKRITQRLQECIIVRKGKIRLDLYGPDKKYFKYIFLNEGQAFISMDGGIGVHFTKDTEILEVKNGPFKQDKDMI